MPGTCSRRAVHQNGTDGRRGQTSSMQHRAGVGPSSGMHRRAGGGCRAISTDGPGGAVGRHRRAGGGQPGNVHQRAGGGGWRDRTDGPAGALGRYVPTSRSKQSSGICTDGGAVGLYALTGRGGIIGRRAGQSSPEVCTDGHQGQSGGMHQRAAGCSRAVCTDGPGWAVGRYAQTGRRVG